MYVGGGVVRSLTAVAVAQELIEPLWKEGQLSAFEADTLLVTF